MNETIIELGNKAYYGYITKEENIEKDVIRYISERIKENEGQILKLANITKESVNMEKIYEILNKESQYKKNKGITMDINGFISGTLTAPKGVILKEETYIEKVVEIYIDAILSRNAVVVSDIDYLEVSVKKLILEIIQIALDKFNVDKNLIQLLPYEEINNEEFNMYKENDEMHIYLEDKEFKEEVEDSKYLEGDIDKIIENINKNGICECAVIYTKDREKAYKFINRVNGKNVFVNAKSYNKKDDVIVDDWYINKYVIYPGQ